MTTFTGNGVPNTQTLIYNKPFVVFEQSRDEAKSQTCLDENVDHKPGRGL